MGSLCLPRNNKNTLYVCFAHWNNIVPKNLVSLLGVQVQPENWKFIYPLRDSKSLDKMWGYFWLSAMDK